MKRLIAAIAAAALIGTGVAVAIPMSASAHDAGLTCSGQSGVISLDLQNYPKNSHVRGSIDGAVLVNQDFGPSYRDSATVDTTVEHSYDIQVTSGDGNPRYNHSYVGNTSELCRTPIIPPVTTPPVVITPGIQDYLPNSVCTEDGIRTAAFVADNTGSNVDVTYTINGTEYVVKAGEARHIEDLPVAKDGTHFTITAGDQNWEFDAPAEDCPIVLPPVEPTVIEVLPAQFVDVCGIEDDEVQVPTDVEHVTYTTDDQRKDGVGVVEVTATADEGYVFEDGKTTAVWGHEFTNEKCAEVPPTEEPTPPVTTPPTEEPTIPTPTDEPTPPAPTTEPTPNAPETPVSDKNCTELGVTNVASTSPLYDVSLDSDKDGVACEAAVVTVHTPKSKAAPTGELAFTGSEGLVQGGIAAGILVLAGIGLAFTVRKRRINN